MALIRLPRQKLKVDKSHSFLASMDHSTKPSPAFNMKELATGDILELNSDRRADFVRFILKV
jgi:hypothetical protein